MSDIVERLHAMIDANYGDVAADSVYGSAMSDAADEIKRLRAALRMFACACADEHLCSVPDNCRNYLARAAMEGK